MDSITWTFVSTQHGGLIMTLRPISAGDLEAVFDLSYTTLNGQLTTYTHTVTHDIASPGFRVTRNVPRAPATLGYGDIKLPPAMQGNGIGYLYHAFLGYVARLQHIDLVVVENVSTGPMRGVCQKTGMQDVFEAGGDNYGGSPVKAYMCGIARGLVRTWRRV